MNLKTTALVPFAILAVALLFSSGVRSEIVTELAEVPSTTEGTCDLLEIELCPHRTVV